ncbi:MAG: non-canonical purine NTP pyrophosphatase, RdgB/HAM1 family [Rhodospirillales bacterium RIFCSPLOWO2_02_FULL_58_16]|nr:MAG: non-canonical purine NTP pyrophosphatase, RdgB/HAM1 family [Rhodospirillales bacterium RIFCSPLOWO2_02_FULL_58_16]
MARIFQGGKLVIASHNPGKVREFADLLAPFGVQVVSAADLNLPEPEESGETFVDNARIKARSAARLSGLPALADDSGLAVTALGGAPGVHSARWAGLNKDFREAMNRVQAALAGKDDRSACFVCSLALCRPDGVEETFDGVVHGHIARTPRGSGGFGYDPIFIADGCDITFAEMEPQEKHAISHRADAFSKLIKACFRE